MADDDYSKSTIRKSRHAPTADTGRINSATERVARGDDAFIDSAMARLDGLEFPAFKHKILEHVQGSDPQIIGLFESLNGYTTYKDAYQVRKAIEENGPKYKVQNQISDETRKRPNFKTREGMGGASTKKKEAATGKEERKDYPEVTPTAMSNFICSQCGKAFQNQDDLVRHQRFEGSNP
ncbi:MAG: C2H2-type zinc finger protein [Nitrososphaera sp.]|jgi:hypothetical protein